MKESANVLIIIILSFVCETGKVDPTPHTSSFNMGYLVSPYPYPNGAGGPIPVSMVSSPVMLSLVLFPLKIWHVSDLPPVCPSHHPSCFWWQRCAFVVRLLSGPWSDSVRLFHAFLVGSWSRYWFMAFANWIHDLYLQPRSHMRAFCRLFFSFSLSLSLECEFTVCFKRIKSTRRSRLLKLSENI